MNLLTKAELYELAKRVHPPERRSPPTLKVLCMDFTIKRWQSYIDLHEKFGINAFDTIAPLLRNDLINRLTSSDSFDWTQREFLLFLLNTQTKSLVLDKCKIDEHQECLPFLTQMTSKAPNLVHLSIGVINYGTRNQLLRTTKTSILSEIVKLKKLQHLKMYGYFELKTEDFVLVTKNLTKLVCFEVLLGLTMITDDKFVGLQSMSDLKDLEEFYFGVAREEDQCRYSYGSEQVLLWCKLASNWCAQNFPRLKLIGRGFNFKKSLGPSNNTPSMQAKFSGTSSLEALHTTSCLPEACLPDLKHLCFLGPNKDSNFVPKMCSFRNLTALDLQSIMGDELNPVLESIGHQLAHFYVKVSDIAELDLYYKIFHFCPNLVKAELDISASLNPAASQFKKLVSGKNFLRLEEFINGHNVILDSNLPADLLFMIFEAPVIRSINLDSFGPKIEFYRWFQDVDIGRFPMLENVYFSCLSVDYDFSEEDLELMVKWLVCTAPKLKSIEIYIGYYEIRNTDWCIENKEMRKFVELLK